MKSKADARYHDRKRKIALCGACLELAGGCCAAWSRGQEREVRCKDVRPIMSGKQYSRVKLRTTRRNG